MNPLATTQQLDTERLALRLSEHPAVRSAREQARCRLLADDPAIATGEGRLGLERALDQWTLALAMREANGNPGAPQITWNVDNTPRPWHGHFYPGAALAVDNPDNVNREMPIDGASRYLLRGHFAANRTANFSLKLEVEPQDHAGIGEHLWMLTSQEIECDEQGRFSVGIGPQPIEGVANHIQTRPGRLTLYARDSFSDWRQQATMLSIERLDGPAFPVGLDEGQLVRRVADFLPAFVSFWSGFKNGFLDQPRPNTLVGPIGRQANWGYLAGGRFELADDQALLITIEHAGARYSGFQVADPWTVAPDPLYRQSSLNSSQQATNPDGSVTFVVSVSDPGVHNWIDTCGLHHGWLLLRWQGFAAEIDASSLIRGCQLVDLAALAAHLPPGCPTVTLEQRRAQIEPRALQYRLRFR
ncbi:hypothetical protein [Pseudomonas sp. NBRC 100443]|uniref:hypothetical protein n=1 Tax=Pseudomonas sp. NBRC 100443 TaxID=1113665 RepID=UPI0024A3776D|nr:hypothetical protein [Pseudomonas sp. NBRC 100443]GLU37319.1 hypothetical protein Pssp01_14120 [Pseudomonas sp. NBRC 100443]